MYTPDLSRLLRMLVETRATEVLATEGAAPSGPWQAHLTVIAGQVTSCHVQRSVDGPSLLSGGEALGWLASQGNLLWERVASTPQRIAAILCQPFYVVEGIVHDLQLRGVIAVETLPDELREEESMV